MGEAELITSTNQLVIHSVLFFYGEASTGDLSCQLANDISRHWNEPEYKAKIDGDLFEVRFEIQWVHDAQLDPDKVWYNDNPRFNFFRIEEFAEGNISYVDGIGSNTGYWKLDNLMQTSTTAAHEYGHTLGLFHPAVLDIRGKSTPGIMYPRGTIVDPAYQYDPNAKPGGPGGTMNPAHRKVMTTDIENLKLHKLHFDNGKAMVGEFSSFYHEKHKPPGA